MIEIREVENRRQRKEFLNFPLKMYKDNPCFVPPLYGDEKKIFSKNYVYYDTCEAVYYNAYKDGVMAGRISGILQKASNEKTGEKRVRFTRFDSVNDIEVARALFDAVEDWALSKGMDRVCGPLGFSDLEREGLLIEGFEHLATFEEQYNAPYYAELIEGCGYVKEIDWLESRLMLPEDDGGELRSLTDQVMERYNLRFSEKMRINKFLKLYADDCFRLIDEGYEGIYGSVPLTDKVKKMLVSNFKLLLSTDYVAVILDENEKPVCMGLCIPSIARAVQKSSGRLTPGCIFRILRAKKNPEYIDLALIAVDKEYLNKGVSVCYMPGIIDLLKNTNAKWLETNLNLENNYPILNMWKRFRGENHKRRRSYIKVLNAAD
ncbi:MAG: hypothetical protein ACOX75_04295 [Lachnospiraceae bacterium]|jgi:hypothetical protein